MFAIVDSEAGKDEESFKKKLESEINILEKKALKKIEEHPWNEHLNIFLFLFPIDNKKEFVKDLHLKLKGAQQG